MMTRMTRLPINPFFKIVWVLWLFFFGFFFGIFFLE